MEGSRTGWPGFLSKFIVIGGQHEEYAGAQRVDIQEVKEQDGAHLLERILSRDTEQSLQGIEEMTIEDALPWLREHREELLESIREGKYKPQPVSRKEIPKPDGGKRQLGIPTVIDRIIQQAVAQQAITKVKEYAQKGYTQAVQVDLSKYFDTLNHELLMNLLRKNVKDNRVIGLIKKYLKAGVVENGLLIKTGEGSPHGGVRGRR